MKLVQDVHLATLSKNNERYNSRPTTRGVMFV